MNEAKTVDRETRISSILIDFDNLRGAVIRLRCKVDTLIGPEPSSDKKEISNPVDPAVLRDLLNQIPGWMNDIRSDIDYNITRLEEGLQ